MVENKKLMGIIIVLVLVSAVSVVFVKMYPSKEEIYLSTDISDFSPSELWNATLTATDVINSTANVEDFRINVGKNGIIKEFYFRFWGKNPSGEIALYQVSMGYKGGLFFVKYPSRLVKETIHPLVFLNELEEVGLLDLAGGGVIEADIGIGSYDANGYKVYAIKEGKKIPLKEISFDIDDYIEIWSFPSGGGQGESVYFLWQDIRKAETVKFDNTTRRIKR